MTISFARHQFPPAIIRHAVWLYVRFTLSYRDVEDLLAERGLDVSYETVRRWVLKFGPLFARELRRRRPRPTSRWHLDEMAVMIAGRQFWLWRAVDDEGEVLDLLVQRRRDKAAAVKLMRKLLKKQGFAPDVLVTDKLRSYGAAKSEIGLSARRMPCSNTREQRGCHLSLSMETAAWASPCWSKNSRMTMREQPTIGPRGPKAKLLVVELAGRPNERRLFAQILAVIGAPQNPRATIVELERTAVRLLGDLGVQVLVLDEIHNVLAASWREQRVVFNTLRYLSNELKLSLVCFGINEARQAINGDVQLARRFDALSLPRWIASKEFEQLVLAIVRNLPLREPSVLTVKGLRRILQTSDGVSARIFRMLNEVAIEAIETGAERITDEALERYKPVGEDEAAFQ